MKTKFLAILFSLFIIGVASAQRTTIPDDLQITKVELGTEADSIGVLDSKKVLKYIPQTTLLDRAELRIQPKLDLKENLSNKATDFSTINHTKYPSVQAVQTELGNYINNSQKAVPNGVATLDASGKLTSNQIPDIAITSVVASNETDLSSFVANNTNYTYEQGDVIVIEDGLGNTTHYMYKGGIKTDVNEYSEINASQVSISQVNGLQTELDELNGSVIRKGTYDASVNNPNLSNPTDISTRGYYYDVAVSGTQFGIDFKQGDMVISDGAVWRKANTSDDNVLSVFGRLGDITALEGDYDTFFYTKTESESRYVNVTGDIMTGSLTASSFTGNGSGLTNVDADLFNGLNSSQFLRSDINDIMFGQLEHGDVTTQMGPVVYHNGDGAANSVIYTSNYLNNRRGGSGSFLGWRWSFYDTPLFTMNINGVMEANSVTLAEIDAAGPKTLVPKDYLQDYVANNSDLPVGFYEEGTFTPTLTSAGATYTITSSDCKYVRKGNDVTVNIKIEGISTTGTPSTSLKINDLPFTSSSLASGSIGRITNHGDSFYELFALLTPGTDSVFLNKKTSLTGDTNIIFSPNFSNGDLYISINYITNVYTP